MSLEHLLYAQEQRDNGYSDMDVLLVMQQQLQQHYDRTRHAATTIQRRWRGYSDRRYIAHLHAQATAIQRTFRGFLARRRVERLRAEQRSRVEAAFYASMAVAIQRVWRGHHSRTHYADFYRRRLYLQHVTQAGQQVARDMRQYSQQRSQQLRAAQQQKFDDAVSQLARNTHHLLSTAAQPSVWRSRWGEQFDARVGGRRMEERVGEEWRRRERQLRQLRAAVRRAERQQQQGTRIQEMFIAGGEEEEGEEGEEEGGGYEETEEEEMRVEEVDEARVRIEVEEKEQLSLDELQLSESTVRQSGARAGDGEEAGAASDELERTVVKSRFPPIHRKPTLDSERLTMDEERERLSLNRSIIWSREHRPVTVERPKERLLR